VGKVATDFDGKTKSFRYLGAPSSQRIFLRELIEGMIDLEGPKVLSVINQPVFFGEIVRVKARSPMRIVPAGGSDVDAVRVGDGKGPPLSARERVKIRL
jgi:hypothetical protein